jgi:hypothetical protein
MGAPVYGDMGRLDIHRFDLQDAVAPAKIDRQILLRVKFAELNRSLFGPERYALTTIGHLG